MLTEREVREGERGGEACTGRLERGGKREVCLRDKEGKSNGSKERLDERRLVQT